ncbi:hypothetical protein HID58_006539, partial [Brassica napus]
VTDLHKAREAIENPELSSEVQSLKEKLDEHSKQLEQSVEKLTQLEFENLFLQGNNQALNTASNKKRRFRTKTSSKAGASGEKAGDTQIHKMISSDSKPDSEKETSREVAAMKSSMTTYLEQVFSQNLDAIQSL